jgi:hypothetical protein
LTESIDRGQTSIKIKEGRRKGEGEGRGHSILFLSRIKKYYFIST